MNETNLAEKIELNNFVECDYKKLKNKLLRKINELDCPDLDEYFLPLKSTWV